MSFDWRHYLTLAEQMQAHAGEYPNDEACYRTVVSRAYYAVYCLVRNYIANVDSRTFYSDDHQAIQSYLLRHPHRPRKRLGNQLRLLRQHRNKADYDNEIDELPINKARRAIVQAQRIMGTLDEIFR